MESCNSRFGVRGHEKLGRRPEGDLPARDAVPGRQQQHRRSRQRDSFVGLASDWGTVKLGRMDTPFKEYGDDVSLPRRLQRQLHLDQQRLPPHRLRRPEQRRALPRAPRQRHPVRVAGLRAGFDFKVQYSTNEAKTATAQRRTSGRSACKYEKRALRRSCSATRCTRTSSASRSTRRPRCATTATATRRARRTRPSQVALKWQVRQPPVRDRRQPQEVQGERHASPAAFESYKNNAYMFIWDARWSQRSGAPRSTT